MVVTGLIIGALLRVRSPSPTVHAARRTLLTDAAYATDSPRLARAAAVETLALTR